MRSLTLFAVGIIVSFRCVACDVCGGIAPSGTIGFTPGNEYHFIGLRSNYRHYSSNEVSLFDGSVSRTSEYFLQEELNLRYAISKRFAIMTSIPVNWARQTGENGSSNMSGFGDLQLSGLFVPLQSMDEAGNMVQQLMIGTGIKLPTGKYAPTAHTMSNMYPGTGAIDFNFTAGHLYQLKALGWQSEFSYVVRTANPHGYRYGNSLTCNLHQFFKIQTNDVTLRPFVGLGLSNFEKDRLDGEIETESLNHGWVLGGRFGLVASMNRWFLSFTGQVPLYQDLGDDQITQKELAQFSVNYLIQKTKK